MMQYLGRSNSNCSSIRMDGGGRGVVPDPRYRAEHEHAPTGRRTATRPRPMSTDGAARAIFRTRAARNRVGTIARSSPWTLPSSERGRFVGPADQRRRPPPLPISFSAIEAPPRALPSAIPINDNDDLARLSLVRNQRSVRRTDSAPRQQNHQFFDE